MKRKLVVLFVMVAFMSLFIPKARACTPAPEPVTTTVSVVISTGGTAAVFPWPLVVMQGAVLLGASPWLIMYHNHPECRDQPTMGDMGACVQKGGK